MQVAASRDARQASCTTTPQELLALILAEEFVLQLHIGALLLAGMRGYADLASFR